MIVKNEAEFIEPCIRQVVPYVNRILIGVDSRSSNGTKDIVDRLAKEFLNIYVEYFYLGENWQEDLVKVQNAQLKATTEEWIWSLDGDEYYPTYSIKRLIEHLNKDIYDGYAFKFWYLVDKEHIYNRKQFVGHLERIWRNKPTLYWKGKFPGTHIHDGKLYMWFRKTERVRRLDDVEYIHFSRLKKSSWRKDMEGIELYNGKYLKKVPEHIQTEIDKVYGYSSTHNN